MTHRSTRAGGLVRAGGQGRGRAADLPLFRRNPAVVDRRWSSPDKPSACTDRRWASSCVGHRLPALAPHLAPYSRRSGRHLVTYIWLADRSLKSRTRAGQLSNVPGWIIAASSGVLSHDLSSCLAHAAVPLMINRKRPGGCAVLWSQRTGGGDNPGLWSSRLGAPAGLLSVRFPGPLAEPAVPASRQRTLHGLCRQAWFGIVQGLGTWPPR